MQLSSLLLVALAGFSQLAATHSWVDELRIIGGQDPNNGKVGRIRDYRGHLDAFSSYLVNRLPEQSICRENQQRPLPTDQRLKAFPGSFVQATYTENGHVSKLPKEDSNSGKIYWFGTTEPDSSMTIPDLLKWTKDGKGGNGKGRLLSVTNFDDTLCFEFNDTQVSQGRFAVAGGEHGQSTPCTSQFQVPDDVKADMYTVYWLWDFSEHFGKEQPGHVEWYTSCMDIEIVQSRKVRRNENIKMKNEKVRK